jgi:hypothetical protein
MGKIILQVLFAAPVYVVLNTALGGDLVWYESLSCGALASMASGVWLHSIGA